MLKELYHQKLNMAPLHYFDKDFPVVLLISNKKETVHSEIASLNEIVPGPDNVFSHCA